MFSWFTQMPVIVQTIILLSISNTVMLCAWYGHLKIGGPRTWIMTVVISWAIAFFEYLFMIPANRIGYTAMSVAQLKILQEVLSLTIFVPFMVLFMKEPLRLNYLWAALCMVGAVYFIFKR